MDCYKFNPVTVVGRFFRNEDDMTIWFTKEKNPVPVKIRANLRLGSLDIECMQYKIEKVSSGNLQSELFNMNK